MRAVCGGSGGASSVKECRRCERRWHRRRSERGWRCAAQKRRAVPGAGCSRNAADPAKPFVLRDPKTLPRRQWVYGRHLIRKFGSATFAPSGSGKTNLFIVEALAMATGRPLLGILPPQRVPGLAVERRGSLRRTGTARRGRLPALRHHGRGDRRLAVRQQRARQGQQDRHRDPEPRRGDDRRARGRGAGPDHPDNQIDVVMIDPFISSHQVPENDNNAIDAVAKTWTGIADVTNTAIDLAHHTRKTGGAEVTVEDGRGAVALLNAVRPARVLNVMTEDEAAKAGVTDGRKRYFRVTDGKNNLAPAGRQAGLVPLGVGRPRQRATRRPARQRRQHGRRHASGSGPTRSTG